MNIFAIKKDFLVKEMISLYIYIYSEIIITIIMKNIKFV